MANIYAEIAAGYNHVEYSSAELYDIIRYEGFEPESYLRAMRAKGFTIKEMVIIAFTGAVRGNAIDKFSDKLVRAGVSANKINLLKRSTRQSKADDLSINRTTSALAPYASYLLKVHGVPGKMTHELPACLQFPAAGALPLNEAHRIAHKDWSIKFSALIGGTFNEQIYNTMESRRFDLTRFPAEIRTALSEYCG
jgi:hypothetical protein